MESRIEMSQHERDVLAVMNRVLLGERTQREAAGLLHLASGKSAAFSGVRRPRAMVQWSSDCEGRPSNRQLGGTLRQQALEACTVGFSDDLLALDVPITLPSIGLASYSNRPP